MLHTDYPYCSRMLGTRKLCCLDTCLLGLITEQPVSTWWPLTIMRRGLANTGQDLFRHKCSLDAYTFVLCTTQLDSWTYKPKMWYIHFANLQFIVFFVTLNIIILRITKTQRDEESVCSALKCSILAVRLHFWSKMTHKDTAPLPFF